MNEHSCSNTKPHCLPSSSESFGVVVVSALKPATLCHEMNDHHLIVILSLLLIATPAEADICTPCPDPLDTYDPGLSEKELTVPLVGLTTCDVVESTALGILQHGTEQCSTFQALGSFCGCPIAANACQGLSECTTFDPDKEVQGFLGYDDFVASCEMVQSYLQSFAQGTETCAQLTDKYSVSCGCPSTGAEGKNDGSENGGGENDPENNYQLNTARSFCPDGSPVGFPDLDITDLLMAQAQDHDPTYKALRDTLRISGNHSRITCQFLEDLLEAGLLPEQFLDAGEVVLMGAAFCGCPPVNQACQFCPSNDITKPDQIFPPTEVILSANIPCGIMNPMLALFKETDLRCWTSKNYAFLCGCNGGTPWYLGADSETQHAFLAWIPRVTGFLSFLGSLYIILDISRERRKVQSMGTDTYHSLLLGMSLFDISSSLAWMVSTLALPEYDEERESASGVYGARGNEATCKAQGFFLELGFVGSTGFTACLTAFYVLTIVYGYREHKMKPLRKYFIAIPTVLAVALASAAIPHYRPFYVACFISNPNSEVDRDENTWRYLIIFAILPVAISILISVSNLGVILAFVCKKSRAAKKWSFRRFGGVETSVNSRRTPSLPTFSRAEAAVFWQAFWYVMAFLLTWVIFLVGQFKPYFSNDDEALYAFWVVLLILNPLMGFWNAFVYVKPWTWDWKKMARSVSSKLSASMRSSHQPGPISHTEPAASGSNMVLAANDNRALWDKEDHTGEEVVPDEVEPKENANSAK